MVRAAAKNHDRVAVVVDPLDYGAVLAEMDRNDGARVRRDPRCGSPPRRSRTPRSTTRRSPATWRRRRAARPAAATISRTCCRCSSASGWTCATARTRTSRRRSTSRRDAQGASVGAASQLQGKELSFNNIADADTALRMRAPVRRAGLRDREARESLRRRGGGQHPRAYDQRLPHGPDLGLRRHHRLQPRRSMRPRPPRSSNGSSSR